VYQLLRVLDLEEKSVINHGFSDSLYVAFLFHRWDPNRVGPLFGKNAGKGYVFDFNSARAGVPVVKKAGCGGWARVPFGRNAPRWTAAEVERAVKAERRWAPQPPALPA